MKIAWIQNVSPSRIVEDVGVAEEEHVDVMSSEVACLAYDVAAWLLTHDAARWAAVSAPVPASFATTTDGLTGMETADMASTSPWGLDVSGQAYFDDAGAVDASRGYHLFVDGTGQPYLAN